MSIPVIIAIVLGSLGVVLLIIALARRPKSQSQVSSPITTPPAVPVEAAPQSIAAAAYAERIKGLSFTAAFYTEKLKYALAQRAVLDIQREAESLSAANEAEWKRLHGQPNP